MTPRSGPPPRRGAERSRSGSRSDRRALGRVDGARGQREGQRRATAKARARTRRRLAGGLVATVLLVGILFVGVLPTRTYLTQRSATKAAEADLRAVRAERAAIERKRDELRTDAAIENLARKEFGFVKPGEEAYNILPAPKNPLNLPEGWPFTGVEQAIYAG